MALNRKQKKQLESAKRKLDQLQELLRSARAQPDDPAEIPRLETEIAALREEISNLKSGG